MPNCRPMADGGMRDCSAGACPPQGSGWGSAESTAPIRCAKPQLPLFIPWCAGTSRHERLVRKCAYAAFESHFHTAPLNPSIPRSRHSCLSIRHSREGGNPEGKGGTNHTQTRPTTKPRFHTLVCRHQPA